MPAIPARFKCTGSPTVNVHRVKPYVPRRGRLASPGQVTDPGQRGSTWWSGSSTARRSNGGRITPRRSKRGSRKGNSPTAARPGIGSNFEEYEAAATHGQNLKALQAHKRGTAPRELGHRPALSVTATVCAPGPAHTGGPS